MKPNQTRGGVMTGKLRKFSRCLWNASLRTQRGICKIWGSQSGNDEGSYVLGCLAVSTGRVTDVSKVRFSSILSVLTNVPPETWIHFYQYIRRNIPESLNSQLQVPYCKRKACYRLCKLCSVWSAAGILMQFRVRSAVLWWPYYTQ
jgi:hypothetical protein